MDWLLPQTPDAVALRGTNIVLLAILLSVVLKSTTTSAAILRTMHELLVELATSHVPCCGPGVGATVVVTGAALVVDGLLVVVDGVVEDGVVVEGVVGGGVGDGVGLAVVLVVVLGAVVGFAVVETVVDGLADDDVIGATVVTLVFSGSKTKKW
ncbi:hypothetical protein QE152_g1279 [Popillia japonica]|uniref:Uncharacterized protein n=2 Tax=Popillia japonica TaxID=7064 RepID=A0AAW1NA21_POPJA